MRFDSSMSSAQDRGKLKGQARYMSDDQLLENPQAFVCMLSPRDKRTCCNSAGALVSHQHRSYLDAPLLMTRALHAVRRLVLVQKRWITSLTEQSGAGKPSWMAAFPGRRRKRRRSLMKMTERILQNWAAKVGLN